MKAFEIASVFEEIAPIELGVASDLEALNLGFKFGDRNTEVNGVGVAWWLSAEVVDAAIAAECNMLIIHEPDLFRFWASGAHTNMLAETQLFNLQKMKKLLDNGICVYTAHSNWDLQLEVGMGPAVADVLSFKERLYWDKMVGIYRIPKTTFGALANTVKAAFSLPFMRYMGDESMPVEIVALGFGSLGSEVEAILANNAQAGIFGELREWPFLQAKEAGVGIIETTHAISESLGFKGVVREMKKRLPHARFEFFDAPFPYKLLQ